VKVLFAYKYLTLGGVETVLRARLDGLAPLGVDAHAWFVHDLGGAPLFAGLRERVHVGDVDGCARLLREGRFDVFCSIDTEEVLAAVAPGDRARLVVECHSPYTAQLGYLQRLDRRTVRAVLVPSRFQADVVRQRAGDGFDVRVVPNPLREVFLAPLEAFPAPPPRPAVAWIGRMDDLKNWRGFLALGEALLGSGQDVELWMAGKPVGPASDLWERAAEHGAARRLRWFRDLPHHRVPALLDAVRDSGGVLVSTSDGESFGMTVAEAMARGCAVAVPHRPPLTELVEDGRTGVTFAAGSAAAGAAAVAALLADAGLRRRLGSEARSSVLSRFTPDSVLPLLSRELRRLAS
jgi:glycosyltransferase involved in cell wall biosynthesis